MCEGDRERTPLPVFTRTRRVCGDRTRSRCIGPRPGKRSTPVTYTGQTAYEESYESDCSHSGVNPKPLNYGLAGSGDRHAGRSTVPNPESPFQPLLGEPIGPRTGSIFVSGLDASRRNPRIREKCGYAPLPPIRIPRTFTSSISPGTRFETTITPSPRNHRAALNRLPVRQEHWVY